MAGYLHSETEVTDGRRWYPRLMRCEMIVLEFGFVQIVGVLTWWRQVQ